MHFTAGNVYRTVQWKVQCVHPLALWGLWSTHWV